MQSNHFKILKRCPNKKKKGGEQKLIHFELNAQKRKQQRKNKRENITNEVKTNKDDNELSHTIESRTNIISY